MLINFYKVIFNDEIFVCSTKRSYDESFRSLKSSLETGSCTNQLILKKMKEENIKISDLKVELLERIHCFNKNDMANRLRFWIRELDATLNIRVKRDKEVIKKKKPEKPSLMRDGKITMNFD